MITEEGVGSCFDFVGKLLLFTGIILMSMVSTVFGRSRCVIVSVFIRMEIMSKMPSATLFVILILFIPIFAIHWRTEVMA